MVVDETNRIRKHIILCIIAYYLYRLFVVIKTGNQMPYKTLRYDLQNVFMPYKNSK